MHPFFKTTLAALGVASLGFAAGGCSGDDDNDFVATTNTQQTPVDSAARRVAVSLNDGNSPDRKVFDRLFVEQSSASSGSNQGIEFDSLGNLHHAADNSSPGAVRVIGNTLNHPAGFDASRDRIIGGAGTTNTTLQNPKGTDLAREAGFLIVADFGASRIVVFGASASGDVAPFASTSLATAPWDVAYDEPRDRLYVALTNGSVAVFDAFGAGGWGVSGSPATPSRTISPTATGTNNSAINLHGIVYDESNDALVVSDVGDAGVSTDGAIYVIRGASSANGTVVADGTIAGPATELGNPVDLELDGNDLRVAEKANDKLLIFTNVFSVGTSTSSNAPVASGGGDLTPVVSVSEEKPESLATRREPLDVPTDSSDLDGTNTISQVLVSQNSGGNGPILRLNAALSATQATFDPAVAVESAKVDSRGDVYATVDSGVVVLSRVGKSRNNDSFKLSRDRTYQNTGLIAAKGLDLVESRGVIVVADFGTSNADSAIRVYGKEGSTGALFSVPTSNGGNTTARVWDIDYCPTNDRLFAAFTDGTVGVYDSFLANSTSTQTPNILTPAGESDAVNRNLHGIVYDNATNTLFVSDVGSAADSTDGEIFVIQSPPTGSTIAVNISAVLAGSNTNLGNPVDLAYDGTNLYVAEKANGGGRVLRFDGIRSLSSGNPSPSVVFNTPNPESVSAIR